MTSSKSIVEPAQVAMLVQGTEVYGIGMVAKMIITQWPEMTVVALNRGPMWDWLEQRGGPVHLLEGLSGYTTQQALRALTAFPFRLRQARRDGARIHELLAGQGIRIIHTHRLAQQLIAGTMRRFGYRSVWQIHNNSSPSRLWGMSQRLNHALARWGADLLLPVSDFLSQNWRDSGVRTITVRNAAKPLFDGPSELPLTGPVRCLTAGRMDSSKGHHVAMEAVAIATKAGCDVTLDLYGGPLTDNPYAGELQERIRALGIGDRVRFMDFCTDLRPRHREYHLGLHGMIDPEPCSMWVCETLVDGLPLLASVTGGTPELVDDGVTGFLYPAGDANALGSRLIELSQNRQRLAAMREAAFARGQRQFTVQRYLDEILAAYAQVV